MLLPHQVEELITLIGAMDRPALARQLCQFHAGFPVDFSHEFLNALSLDRLRHIYLALCLQSQHMPEVPDVETDLPTTTAA